MIHINEITPRYSSVLVTGDKYEEDQIEKGIIVANKGDLKLNQTVVAVGSMVRDINVGDMVMFDPTPYAEMKYDKNSIQNDLDNNRRVKWHLPWVTMYDEHDNPKDYLMLSDHDIKFSFKGTEHNETLVVQKKKLVVK